MAMGKTISRKLEREKQVRINVSIHPAIKKMLDASAKEFKTSRSGLITVLVQFFNLQKQPGLTAAISKAMIDFIKIREISK